MTNIGVIACYLPFIVMYTVMAVLSVMLKQLGRYKVHFMFMAGSMLGWLGSVCAYYASSTVEMSVSLYDLKLPFVALSTLAFFLLVMRFYHLDDYLSKEILLCLLIIPSITLVLSLIDINESFLYTSINMTSISPLHVAELERGAWFWAHTAYCYALGAISFIIALTRHLSLPKKFRFYSRFLFLAIILSLSGNVAILTQTISMPLDLSLIGASLCGAILFYVFIGNKGMGFLYMARGSIFNSLREAVLVLDDDGIIISRNRAADKWLMEIGAASTEDRYQEIVRLQKQLADYVDEKPIEGSGIDYHFSNETRDWTVNLQEKDIKDKNGKLIGRLITCSDVTENRVQVRKLEEVAGMDALTGLSNRGHMDELIKELDMPENFPLSVVRGDIGYRNNVNDSVGYQRGDVLLRSAAEILIQCCPPNAYLGRIGGGEFLILLPVFPKERALQLIDQISERLATMKDYSFEIPMVFGAAVKENPEESLRDTISEANNSMLQSNCSGESQTGS